MSSELPLDCRKAISRWCKDGFYVYLRPISRKWLFPHKKHKVYWNVLVEFRNVEWKQWRAEGTSLAECIRELEPQIPRMKGEVGGGHMAPKRKKRKKKVRAD